MDILFLGGAGVVKNCIDVKFLFFIFANFDVKSHVILYGIFGGVVK